MKIKVFLLKLNGEQNMLLTLPDPMGENEASDIAFRTAALLDTVVLDIIEMDMTTGAAHSLY